MPCEKEAGSGDRCSTRLINPIAISNLNWDSLVGGQVSSPSLSSSSLPLLMALPFAFATLLTSDSYLPGALALVGALKDVHPSPPVSPEVDFQTVCLVTPETVDVTTIKLLRRAFNVVIGVELIGQEDEKGLNLLGECAIFLS